MSAIKRVSCETALEPYKKRKIEASTADRKYFSKVYDEIEPFLGNFAAYNVLEYVINYFFIEPSIVETKKPENISKKRCVTSFLKEGQDDFRKQLKTILSTNKVICAIKNNTHPFIAIPTTQAMHILIDKYREKYGINIQFIQLNLLCDFLKKTNDGYVGVIVQADKPFDKEAHVVSLLCYFGNQKHEFLLIDSSLPNSFAKSVVTQLQQSFANARIYVCFQQTQVDFFSCRLSALLIMRNIFLFLKKNTRSQGIAKLLDSFSIPLTENDSVFNLAYLPLNWVYTEQTCHPKNRQKQVAVMRELFSKNAYKKQNPSDTTAFRNKHLEWVHFDVKITLDNALIETLKQLPKPVGVMLADDSVIFKVEMQVNTYLAKKGFSCLKKVESLQSKIPSKK